MFKCAITGKFSRPGDKPIRLIVEKRERVYVETYTDEDDNVRREHIVGRGWEIVKEIDVTLSGLSKWCTQHPDDAGAAERFEHLKKLEALQRAARLKAGSSAEAA